MYLVEFHGDHRSSKPSTLPATLAVHVLVGNERHVLGVFGGVPPDLFRNSVLFLFFHLCLHLEILLPSISKEMFTPVNKNCKTEIVFAEKRHTSATCAHVILCLPILVCFLDLQDMALPFGTVEQGHAF